MTGNKTVVEIAGRAVDCCKFISIYGFHLHFDHFKILEDDVPEFMVEMVNVNNVLECRRLGKDIIITEDLQLFFDCLKILICHIITLYKQNALKCACVSTEA